MRSAVVALIAFALVNPSAALAAAPNGGKDWDLTQSMLDKAEHSTHRQRKKARSHAQRKSAKATPVLKHPEPARSGPAIDNPGTGRPGSQAVMPPSCSSVHSGENSRRCLRLAEPAPVPTPMPLARPSAAAYLPVAPFAAPSRSWLGAFSKRIVTQIAEIAEALYADGDNWRMIMKEEVQRELEQARLKEQAGSKQHIGQASPRDVSSGSQPRRPTGFKT